MTTGFSRTPIFRALLLLSLAVLVCLSYTYEAKLRQRPDTVIPAAGFERRMLSDYHPNLKNLNIDTPVFVLKGAEPGGTALVLGGTHPNEPSGFLAAVLFLENARVDKGSLIVLPFANEGGFAFRSGYTGPEKLHFTLPDKTERAFRLGSRRAGPALQWPDAARHFYKSSGKAMPGNEARNLNRVYPGDPDGTPVEQLAHAIMELLRKENVTLAFDLHEASPEAPIADTLIAHEKGMELAASAVLDLADQGIAIKLESSQASSRGLSHREWGDRTTAMPILLETTNPAQGKLRGRSDEALVLTGKDKAYAEAAARGLLNIPYGPEGKPLAERAARHCAVMGTCLRIFDQLDARHGIAVSNIPGFEELVANGIGRYLTPLAAIGL